MSMKMSFAIEFRQTTKLRSSADLFQLRSSFSFVPRFMRGKQYVVEPVNSWRFTQFLARAVFASTEVTFSSCLLECLDSHIAFQ